MYLSVSFSSVPSLHPFISLKSTDSSLSPFCHSHPRTNVFEPTRFSFLLSHTLHLSTVHYYKTKLLPFLNILKCNSSTSVTPLTSTSSFLSPLLTSSFQSYPLSLPTSERTSHGRRRGSGLRRKTHYRSPTGFLRHSIFLSGVWIIFRS